MEYRDTWNLATVPEDVFKREWSRRSYVKRKAIGAAAAGGRPKVVKPCPKCGQAFSAREMRRHSCE